jgi:hypothetical protein
MYRVTVISKESREQMAQWDQMEPVTMIQEELVREAGCFLDVCRFDIEPAFSDLLGVHDAVEYELEDFDEGFDVGPLQ